MAVKNAREPSRILELEYLTFQLHSPNQAVERRVEQVDLPNREKYNVTSTVQTAPLVLEQSSPVAQNPVGVPVSAGLYVKIRVPTLKVYCEGKELPVVARRTRGALIATALLNWVKDRDVSSNQHLQELKRNDPSVYELLVQKLRLDPAAEPAPDLTRLRDRIATIAVSDVQTAIVSYIDFLVDLLLEPAWRDLIDPWVLSPRTRPRKMCKSETESDLEHSEVRVTLPEQVLGLVFNTHVVIDSPFSDVRRRTFQIQRSERLSWQKDIGQQRTTNMSLSNLTYDLEKLKIDKERLESLSAPDRKYLEDQLKALEEISRNDDLHEWHREHRSDPAENADRSRNRITRFVVEVVRPRLENTCRYLNLIPALVRIKCLNADHSYSYYLLFEAPSGVEVVRSYWSTTRNDDADTSLQHRAGDSDLGEDDASAPYYEVAHEQSRSILAHHSDVQLENNFPLCAYAELQIRSDSWLRVVTAQVALLFLLTLAIKFEYLSSENRSINYLFGLPAGILAFASLATDSVEAQIARWLRRILLTVGGLSIGYTVGFALNLSTLPRLPDSMSLLSLSWLDGYNALASAFTAVVLINLIYLSFGPRHFRDEPASPVADLEMLQMYTQGTANRAICVFALSIVLGLLWLIPMLCY